MTDAVPPPEAPAESPPQPTWRPPRDRQSNTASIVIGVIFVLIGAWFFLDQTLGLRLPRIRWGDFWPVALILIGGLMIYRSAAWRK